MLRKEKGITLVALVVTIIVILILAAVSINLVIGDNGIITRTKESKIQAKIEDVKEKIKINVLENQIDGNGKIADYDLKRILEENGTLSDEENIMDKTLILRDENYEVKVSEILKGIENQVYSFIANEPDLSGFNKNSTYYVSWNLNKSPFEIEENILISKNEPENWYDYSSNKNQYANIKTTGGQNECYWVWIPRYAYCITEGYHTNEASKIDIKYLKGRSNDPIDGSNIELSNSVGVGNWNVHPAFYFDDNNNGIIEENEQLTGIWVAKYEASSSKVNNINLEEGNFRGDINSLNENGGGIDTNLKVRVKPNVTSWRGISVNNIFDVCQNMIKADNSLCSEKNIQNKYLDSHMMKNIEWGAVAYISSSKYGKKDNNDNVLRVFNNPYYNNTVNFSSATGLSGKSDIQVNNGITTNLYEYNTIEGTQASTTGNVYGIYDFAGGSWEYVAGIYSSGKLNNNITKLLENNNSKYVDKYSEGIGSSSNYYGNINKYGDAVFETTNSGDNRIGAWNSNVAYFPNSDYVMFLRGGRASIGGISGVFSFSNDAGEACNYISFRPVVINLNK